MRNNCEDKKINHALHILFIGWEDFHRCFFSCCWSNTIMLMLSRIVETAFKFMERGTYQLDDITNASGFRCCLYVCVSSYFIRFSLLFTSSHSLHRFLLNHRLKLLLATFLFFVCTLSLVCFCHFPFNYVALYCPVLYSLVHTCRT